MRRRRGVARTRRMGVRPLRKWWSRDVLVVAVPAVALVALTFCVASRYIQPAPPDHLVMATGALGRRVPAIRRAVPRISRAVRRDAGASGRRKAPPRTSRCFAMAASTSRSSRAASASRCPTSTASRPSFRSARSTTSRCGCSCARIGRRSTRLRSSPAAGMAIGAEGSGTRSLALQLLQDSGIEGGARRLCRSAATDMLQALDAGEVDVVFQVAGIEAPIVGDAPAPARLETDEPRARRRVREAQCPSDGADGAARRRRHRRRPASARHRGRRHDGQSARAKRSPSRADVPVARYRDRSQQRPCPALRGKTFPNPRGQDMPIAEEAQRYYKSGKPFLKDYLPYWAANFVDRMLILLIPIVRRADPGDQVCSRALHLSAEIPHRPLVRATCAPWRVEMAGQPDAARDRRLPVAARRHRSARSRADATAELAAANRSICCARRSISCASGSASPDAKAIPACFADAPRDGAGLGTPAGPA